MVSFMLKKLLSITAFFYLALISHQTTACADHLYLNPDDYGVVKRTALRWVGLVAPEPVFKLKHPSVAKATPGETSEITIEYERPWLSRNVHMELKSTSGIKLMDKSIALDDFDGTVKIRYLLEKPGYNSITINLNGEHKGQGVANYRVIYIQAKKILTETKKSQVSGR
jgi:hypothetical protein